MNRFLTEFVASGAFLAAVVYVAYLVFMVSA